LLRRVPSDGPALGHRPAALLPGRDQQDFRRRCPASGREEQRIA
jgi:hypothetical protein